MRRSPRSPTGLRRRRRHSGAMARPAARAAGMQGLRLRQVSHAYRSAFFRMSPVDERAARLAAALIFHFHAQPRPVELLPCPDPALNALHHDAVASYRQLLPIGGAPFIPAKCPVDDGHLDDGIRYDQPRTEHRENDSVAVVVEDTGPGINPDQIDSIFGAFVTTKSQGTGLGLAICRMIVERHGGQLTASSDGKSGALFQFDLPVRTVTRAAAE